MRDCPFFLILPFSLCALLFAVVAAAAAEEETIEQESTGVSCVYCTSDCTVGTYNSSVGKEVP